MTISIRRVYLDGMPWQARVERPADGSKTLVLTVPWLMVRVSW